MQTECPSCATVVTVTVDGDLPDFPIRIEWNSEIKGRYAGVAVVDSHEPASEVYHSDRDLNTYGITVVYDEEFLGVSDLYGDLICIVHVCDSSGDAGDRARVVHPPPSRPASAE